MPIYNSFVTIDKWRSRYMYIVLLIWLTKEKITCEHWSFIGPIFPPRSSEN